MKRALLFQSHTAQVLGGAELSLLSIMEEAKQKGYEVHVIVPSPGGFAEQAERLGCQTHIIKSYWWTYNRENEFSPNLHRRAISRTTELIRQIKPLLCITNTLVVPWLAAAAAIAGVRHVWILREYGDSDQGLEFWLPIKEVVGIVDRLSDRIFTNSEALKRHFQPLVKQKKIGVLTPVIKQPVPTAQKSPYTEGSLKLVCVGTVRRGKGQLDAVKAIHGLKIKGIWAQLLLVGAVPDRKYLGEIKGYVKEHHLGDSVKLCGHKANPADIVSFADIALVCSKNEGFGRTTIEALLLGVPVIGTDAGGTSDILHGQAQDLLYSYGDAGELADKIQKLTADRPHLELITKKLKAEVAHKYSSKHANSELFNYLANIKNQPFTAKDSYLVTGLLDHQKERRGWRTLKAIKRAMI